MQNSDVHAELFVNKMAAASAMSCIIHYFAIDFLRISCVAHGHPKKLKLIFT